MAATLTGRGSHGEGPYSFLTAGHTPGSGSISREAHSHSLQGTREPKGRPLVARGVSGANGPPARARKVSNAFSAAEPQVPPALPDRVAFRAGQRSLAPPARLLPASAAPGAGGLGGSS